RRKPIEEINIQDRVIRNINTYARTKTIAQGFLDMALFTANASQMKHLLQEGPSTQFYYFLFVLLVCINKWTTFFYLITATLQPNHLPPMAIRESYSAIS
uniref:Uncharacterized protein n=1 Tax=Callorhinchus milii TaxID=7868 RepID=A0A4W3K139_CALMI